MAEYTRGQDPEKIENSGYNKTFIQSPKISPVNGFEEMNYEQVRAPYQRNSGESKEEDKDCSKDTGRQRGEI